MKVPKFKLRLLVLSVLTTIAFVGIMIICDDNLIDIGLDMNDKVSIFCICSLALSLIYIMLAIFYIGAITHETSYKNHVYMSFRRLKKLYRVNPDKWSNYGPYGCYSTDEDEDIYPLITNIFSVMAFKLAKKSYDLKISMEHDNKEIKKQIDTAQKLVDSVQKDINKKNKLAEREISEANNLMRSIRMNAKHLK